MLDSYILFNNLNLQQSIKFTQCNSLSMVNMLMIRKNKNNILVFKKKIFVDKPADIFSIRTKLHNLARTTSIAKDAAQS